MAEEKLHKINPDPPDELLIIKKIQTLLGVKLEPVAEIEWDTQGYTVNTDGQVAGLGLYQCKIGDKKLPELAEALRELTHLTELVLINNQLTDISALRELTNLTKLYLSANQLTDIAALRELTHLTQLDLYNNQLTDIAALRELTHLTQLCLSDNQLTDIAALRELTNLTQLYLIYNKLTDIAALRELTNLTQLYLSYNKLTDIAALRELTNLTQLDVRNNQLTNIPPEFFNRDWKIRWEDDYIPSGLNLYNNPLEIPPVEIVRQGREAIRNYFEGRGNNWDNRVNLFTKVIQILISQPSEEEADLSSTPIWLQYRYAPALEDVSRSLVAINLLHAITLVYHRETTAIPVYADSIMADTEWDRKERQEQEDRLIRIFMNPVQAIDILERLSLQHVVRGSVNLYLGKTAKWSWTKLKKLLTFIPEWKKEIAEARQTDVETEKIKEETKTIAPDAEVKNKKDWEEVYKMKQDRVLEGAERQLEMMEKVLDMAPPEMRNLPPKAVMALLMKIMSTMDGASTANDLGKLLTENEINKLPPFNIEQDDCIDLDGPDELEQI